MMISKMSLPRRTVLRGMGVALGLPLLDAMVPALSPVAKTAAAPVRRMGFVYSPNGQSMNKNVNYWTPKGEGTNFEMSTILQPLSAFRDQMIVVSGLRQLQADALGDGNGEHTRASAAWLNGMHPKKTEGSDIRAGMTADQIAANALGKDTALPSLELAAFDLDGVTLGDCDPGYSCVYVNTVSWATATTPLPTISNPRLVFERLFGDGGTLAERRGRAANERSILDWVRDDMARISKTLGPSDRRRVTEYLDAVREVERRIQKTEQNNNSSALPETLDRPAGIPVRFDDHANLMYDLQWLAFQADLTRVATFMLGKEQNTRTFPEIGISEPWHPVSHHQDNPEQLAKLAKVNVFHAELFGRFLEKLRATPDGEGTLLDHTMYLYGAGISNPNLHLHVDLPLMLVGGMDASLKGGRHLRYAPETPMANLLLSMLDKAGVPAETIGDSTGRLNFAPLTGL